MLQELCSSTIMLVEGCLARATGDFKSAMTAIQSSIRSSRDYQLAIEPIAHFELASLLWSSGLFEKALEQHQSDSGSNRFGRLLAPSWVLQSHLSAAKCAIDLANSSIATTELRTAEQLLRETSCLPEMLGGYYVMYSGELKILNGALDEGLQLLEEACQHFEKMDPPFHAGLLDAKISMAQHAITSRDYKKLLTVIHKLLDEAEQNGCLEARTRLLVVESALFVSENPPLRDAYQDLVTRMHLINNPALMLQALGNLFVYSLRYLDQPDQAFLMARLRRLQKVLDESCFQDLYEKYIEQRYSWAIENRLAEFLEAEESLLEDEETEPA